MWHSVSARAQHAYRRDMRLNNTAIAVLGAVIMVVGVGMLAYRTHLQVGAHWITKTLCEDRPVFSGAYNRCLEHYAPAGLD